MDSYKNIFYIKLLYSQIIFKSSKVFHMIPIWLGLLFQLVLIFPQVKLSEHDPIIRKLIFIEIKLNY